MARESKRSTARPSRAPAAPPMPAAVDYTWDDLKCFLELARRGRLVQAAKHLGVEHTTVSRRIGQLERTLDVKLFHRAATGYTLSTVGQQLLDAAERMEQAALAVGSAIGKANPLSGQVRLATMEAIGSFYIAPNLDALRVSHPEITLELVTSTQLLNLTKREADFSLSFMRPTGARIVVRKTGTFALNLYAGPSYLVAHGAPTRVEDLQKHAFVDYVDELISIPATRWLREVIAAPRIVFRSTGQMAHHSACAAGVGLALLPTFSAARDPRIQPVLPRTIVVQRDLWLAVHYDLRHHQRIKAVERFIVQLVEGDRAFLEGRASA